MKNNFLQYYYKRKLPAACNTVSLARTLPLDVLLMIKDRVPLSWLNIYNANGFSLYVK